MKTCALCEKETSEASPVQVVPASWTKFNSYVDICTECRESERFQKMIKAEKPVRFDFRDAFALARELNA